MTFESFFPYGKASLPSNLNFFPPLYFFLFFLFVLASSVWIQFELADFIDGRNQGIFSPPTWFFSSFTRFLYAAVVPFPLVLLSFYYVYGSFLSPFLSYSTLPL